MLSIMGLGLLSYHLGRSHDYNLIMTPYPATLILALFADRLLNDFKESKIEASYINHRNIFLLIILYFFSNSLVSLLYYSDHLFSTIKVSSNILTQSKCNLKNTSPVSKNIDFIKQHTHPGENILILAQDSWEGIYYGESETRSILDISSIVEWFLKSDVEQIRIFLETNNSSKVFVYPSISPEPAFNQILTTKYAIAAQSESGMALWQRK